MIRSNADSWYSRAEDSNPFFEDGDRPQEYNSFWSKWAFKLFRFVCIVVLYLMLGWSTLLIILSLYGFAHFDAFADAIQNCLDNAGDPQNDEFRHHHSVRLTILMIYGLSATAFTLQASRASEFSVVVKVCLLVLGFIISLASLSGDIVEMIWPFRFDATAKECTSDWYVLLLYQGWPWYTATLLLFAIFNALKYVERKYFIIQRE